jgi:predicted small lipoprotein YifL
MVYRLFTQERNMIKKLILLLILLSLAACGPLTPVPSPTEAALPPSPTSAPTILPSATARSVTATPRPFATWTSEGKTSTAAAGLVILTWELPAPPELDPLKFITKDLTSHKTQEMGQGEPFVYNWIDTPTMGMAATLGEKKLIATENYNQDGTQGWVAVSDGQQEIYRIETGKGSPIPALRGIWIYDDHWVLEANFYTDDNPFNGHIIQDGILLNDEYGYEAAFGFQTIAGKPFYLFKRNGKIDAWYAGQEIPLGFDEIPHYGCCSSGELNPRQWTTMIAFFGIRGKTWHFVQIGTPDNFK